MSEVFEVAASNARWGLVVMGLIPMLIGLGLIVSGLNAPRVEVSTAGLRLQGELYGRFIPKAKLKLAEARVVDVTLEPHLAPSVRTFGTGMPGYNVGWYRLRNGEYALLYLTNRKQAVYVPTTSGYSVLVSPKDAMRFLESLKKLEH